MGQKSCHKHLSIQHCSIFSLLEPSTSPLILDKAGLNQKISNFFKNYLVRRKTNYCWNDFVSSSSNINVGVGQESALLPILSALYLSPVFHSSEKHLKFLKISISIISFVNDGLSISQNKSISHSNANLFCSYNIILSLLSKYGLIIEQGKTDVFHFSRSQGIFNPPPLDLSSIGGPSLLPKETWRYLGFIFNHKLTFRSHIDFYPNKVISTIKCMKLLGNSTRGINPLQKRKLYRCCALPIALYGLPVWNYNKAPTYYHLNILRKMQWRTTLWITGAFRTSPTLGVQVATSISHIHSFNKLVIKILHRAINVTTAEAKPFTIQYGINQAVTISNTNHIIIITDSLHIARKIFDSSAHPYQIHLATIFQELREFFFKDICNCIEFWDYSSKQQWPLHHTVDKETKNMVSIPSFSYKSSWDFCKKSECDSILLQWRMIFQASDFKERNFLDLLDNNLNPIKLSSSKGSPWLSQFGHSNLLYT